MQKLITIIGFAFFFFILWIIYLANTGTGSIFFDFVNTIPFGDKLGHFLLFGSLTFIGIIALKFRFFYLVNIKIYYGVAFVSAFVICEEFSQTFISSRTFDLMDLASDLLGVIVASNIAHLTKKRISKSATKH